MFIIHRQGSKEVDSSSSTERFNPVMLSTAKHLAAHGERPFAVFRVTWCDCQTVTDPSSPLNLALTTVTMTLYSRFESSVMVYHNHTLLCIFWQGSISSTANSLLNITSIGFV